MHTGLYAIVVVVVHMTYYTGVKECATSNWNFKNIGFTHALIAVWVPEVGRDQD